MVFTWAFALVGSFGFAQAAVAALVDATDTIAGYSAGLTTTAGSPGETVVFRVQKPQGIIEISETADEHGIATTDFDGFHTTRAGDYSVRAYPQDKSWKAAPEAAFTVYPDATSPVHSSLTAIRDAAAANGREAAQVRARLVDRHGNEIPNHLITLISSRTEDKVEAIGSGFTNQNGEVVFEVRSQSDGVSTLSAYDKNTGVTLDARAKVVFFKQNGPPFAGGNLNIYQANSFFPGDDAGDNTYDKIDHFNIEIADEAQFGVPTDITITAADKNDKTVRDYNRTIIIQATDDLATLPNGGTYQFSDFDEGKKVFTKGLTFSETGTHTITVFDFDGTAVSPNIKGEATVKVVEECVGEGCGEPIETTPPPTSTPSNADLEIKIPATGSKLGDSSITIFGSGSPNSDINLYLDDVVIQDGNEQPVIVPINGKGDFDYQLKNISDGSHSIYVQEVEGDQAVSQTVTFEVDATPPDPADVSIYPEGEVEKGATVRVTAFAEPNLKSVTIRFGSAGEATELFPSRDEPNKYSMSVKAPETPGEYILNVELLDELENMTQHPAQASLVVKADSILAAPSNVTATAGTNTVTLSWLPPPGQGITAYRVYSGTNQLIVDTVAAEVVAPANSAIISGLQNGQLYYFTVSAVGQGNIESARSLPVSATPIEQTPLATPTIFTPTPTPFIAPLEAKSVVAIPRDGSVELQWDAPTQPASYFDIQFGISSGVYSERFSVSGRQRSAIIPDLINNIPYYFTVVPLDQYGVPTGEEYTEVRKTPQFSGIHSAAEYPPIYGNFDSVSGTPDSGIEAFFLFFLSVSFAASMFFFHRAIRYALA